MPSEPEAVTRVLFVSHWFPRRDGDWGGIFVQEQALALRALGIDVRVLVGDPMADIAWRQPASIVRGVQKFLQSPQPTWRSSAGVPAAFVPFLTPHPRVWAATAPHAYVMSLRRWSRALVAFKPQIVHAHTAFLDAHAGAWLARKLKVPFVVTEGTGPFETLTRTPAQRRLTENAINAADVLLPVSAFQARAIGNAVTVSPRVAVKIVGNGYHVSRFVPSPLPPFSPYRLLWIGHLDDNKQPLLLLDAFARAVATRPELSLTLIGDGPLAATVGERLSRAPWAGRVTWQKSASRDEVAAALREHHGLVIASKVETFGVVLVEALGSGRRVLTTACGGPEEIIAATGGGEVVAGTAEALSDGMVRMANTVDRSDPWALAKVAASHYSYPEIARSLSDLYRELQASKAAP